MAHLASYFDQPNGQPANERVPFHTNDAQNGSNGMSRVPRSASANQDAFYILDDGDEEGEDDGTALDREDERATAEGDDDDLSTTSGPRHGALLQPEMDDWMLLEVSCSLVFLRIGSLLRASTASS